MNSKTFKKITIIIFSLFFLFDAFSQIKIFFIYKNTDYFVGPIEMKEIEIEPFNALPEIDQSQTHRLLLSYLEKSRLTALLYVGDKYEFNNVEIMLKYNDIYQIMDKENGLKISFTLGNYDNIILLSAVNFDGKEFNIIDKLASAFAVKMLLKKLTGNIDYKDTAEASKPILDTEILKEYDKFIQQLKKLPKREVFDYINKYAELNFQLEGKKKLTEEWVHPANLYFYKKGDYKSFAFFYYYTLKRVGFTVRSYLVSDLIKKNSTDIENMHDLFTKNNRDSNDLAQIQQIEMLYKSVNSATTPKDFIFPYKNAKYTIPSPIYFYYPPNFADSIFLITVEINDKWIYTTGDKWIDAGIYTPERSCSHYTKNGCYYSYIEEDTAIINNTPFSEKDIIWDVFYEVK